MNAQYKGEFNSYGDVISQFGISQETVKESEILFAEYETPDYEGYASVVFLRNNKLYLVCGSHCSCYGLEGQWEPEETSMEALLLHDGYMRSVGEWAVLYQNSLTEIK